MGGALMAGPVCIQPCWELFCSVCDWSASAFSFSEAEDRAAVHEQEHEVAA
jgi:hypothetical protein